MQPKVSIIVPIYNVEKYIHKCIDSILSQTFTDFELILVDDGSPDKCGEICEQYALKDNRIKVVHKENGGLSDARNAGIDVASGKYIYFIDSDDWISPNSIISLLNFAEDNQCEIVQGGFYYAYENQMLYSNGKIKENSEPFCIDREEAMMELIKNNYIKNFAWGKLYLTSIVKEHKFLKGVYFEDSYWQHLIIHEITKYGIIPSPLYFYIQRASSISGDFSIRNLDLLKGYESRISFIEVYYPQFYNLVIDKFWEVASNFYRMSKKINDNTIKIEYKKYWLYINSKYHRSLKNKIKYSRLFQMLLKALNYGKRLFK